MVVTQRTPTSPFPKRDRGEGHQEHQTHTCIVLKEDLHPVITYYP